MSYFIWPLLLYLNRHFAYEKTLCRSNELMVSEIQVLGLKSSFFGFITQNLNNLGPYSIFQYQKEVKSSSFRLVGSGMRTSKYTSVLFLRDYINSYVYCLLRRVQFICKISHTRKWKQPLGPSLTPSELKGQELIMSACSHQG